jgi:alpha-D-xyloside xylohydrolase
MLGCKAASNHVGSTVKNVLFYGPEAVRVNANLGEAHTIQPSLTVVTQPAPVPSRIEETDAALKLTSAALNMLVDKKTGALTFQRPDGAEITRESAAQPTETRKSPFQMLRLMR